MAGAEIGVVGLGVMGHNLALNIERNGYPVGAFNRDTSKTRVFLQGLAAGKRITGATSLAELARMLEKPRRILLMVAAGDAVDSVIASLRPHLDQGDILIDGGNSFFLDTDRRSKELASAGLNFVGMGVSGGEEGALWGPSIMPGGTREAWDHLKEMLRAIAAKAPDGEPCVDYMGPRGAGHYVKMVHNGIEYGDMQLIAEVYDLLHRGLGLNAAELSEIFTDWNQGVLQSYLIEITATILKKMDPNTGLPLVDMILDEAAQKGTGKWTSQNALDVGAPIPTIDAAVQSRMLSSLKSQRVTASHFLRGPQPRFRGQRQALIDAARDALYVSKITSYAQGLGLLRQASQEYSYDMPLGSIAKIWRAGCIIRAGLLSDITAAFERDPALPNLLLDEAFHKAVDSRQVAWRKAVKVSIGMGIPMLATSSSLAYYDAYRSERLPANLTQAQRDFFGAHTYRRIDKEGVFHTNWTE